MDEHIALKPPTGAYDVDVYAWTKSQAELMRSGRLDIIDVENIIVEIESLGSEQAHSVESYLVVVLEHLLKLGVSVDRDPQCLWPQSIVNGRKGIKRRLKKSPTLSRELPSMFADAWPDARDQARNGLRVEEESLVPATPSFTLVQALDPDFFPPRY